MLVARASSGRRIPCRERHHIYVHDHLVFAGRHFPFRFRFGGRRLEEGRALVVVTQQRYQDAAEVRAVRALRRAETVAHG